MDCNDRQKSEKRKGDDLVSTIKDLARRGELLPTQMLPTPRSFIMMGKPLPLPESIKHHKSRLENVIAMLPTPAASQMGKPIRPLAPPEADGSHGTMLVGAIGQAIGESGESAQRLGLNPEFVEVMMNLPVGWTELTD
jgi:hypothetical protein